MLDLVREVLGEEEAVIEKRKLEPGVRLSDVVCPQCKEPFRLDWNGDDGPLTLIVRYCPSGGVYDVSIRCPHCGYEEEL
jgi:hypothetical protein